jgi:ribonuclease HI
MELLAAIKGLEWLTHPYRVAVYSDSQYLVNGAQRSRGKIKKNKPNPDLWERLVDACAGHQVTFEWIRGHSKIPGNERCDELAKAAARGQELEVDVGYEEKVHCQPNRGPVPTCREATVIGVGKPCPDCGCLCEQRRPKKKPKPDQKYYYEYYLFCPDCRKVYMPPEARHALG